MTGCIDVHTHLNMLKGQSVDSAIAHAKKQNVEKLINISTGPQDHQVVLDIAKKYYPYVSCTLGMHPHDAKDSGGKSTIEFVRCHAQDKEVVAIGEIGLDYYYEHSPKDVQKKVFEEYMQLAMDFNLPVEIHTRDAEEDTVEILKNFPKVKGIFHCFTGSGWMAERGLELGYNISISGVVTFKNAKNLRSIVENIVPLGRMHVETDAPFLAPQPFRGEENCPGFVVETAKCVAELKKVSLEELYTQLKLNAKSMFPRLSWD